MNVHELAPLSWHERTFRVTLGHRPGLALTIDVELDVSRLKPWLLELVLAALRAGGEARALDGAVRIHTVRLPPGRGGSGGGP